jgi:hypothetical protein
MPVDTDPQAALVEGIRARWREEGACLGCLCNDERRRDAFDAGVGVGIAAAGGFGALLVAVFALLTGIPAAAVAAAGVVLLDLAALLAALRKWRGCRDA